MSENQSLSKSNTLFDLWRDVAWPLRLSLAQFRRKGAAKGDPFSRMFEHRERRGSPAQADYSTSILWTQLCLSSMAPDWMPVSVSRSFFMTGPTCSMP